MQDHSDRFKIACLVAELHSITDLPGLKARGADLPRDLDSHLTYLIDAAAGQTAKRGADLKHLLSAFASGEYTGEELDATIDALNTSRTGVTVQSHLCTWLLGAPRL